MILKSIDELYLKHKGHVAWLFGKGPSLDTFDQVNAGQLKICINESIREVSSPSYFFAHDEIPICNSVAHITKDCVLVLQPERARFAIECGVSPDQIFVYAKNQQTAPIAEPDPQLIARTGNLIGLSSTAHSAIHFCKLIGVESIKLVGFDGAGGYAKCLNLELPCGGFQHAHIRRDSEQLLNNLGFEYEFISKNPVDSGAVSRRS